MKRNKKYEIPITDPRVLAITLESVEKFCEALEKCENNPDYLLNKTNIKTTKRGEQE